MSSKTTQPFDRRDFLKLALGGGAALGALGLAGCAPQTAQEAELERVLVRLLWLLNVEFGGFWAAQDQGYYAEEGLAPEFLPGGPGIQVETIVAAGGEPIGVTGSSTTFVKSIEAGTNLKCIGAVFQKHPGGLMSLPENPVRTMADVAGKKIGLQPGARNAFTMLMSLNGIDPESVEIVPVGFDPSPLPSGEVDAIWVYIPNQPNILRVEGFDPVVMYSHDEGNAIYGNIILALESTIQNQRDMLVRWMRASQKGWAYNAEHSEEMARLTVEEISPNLELNLEQQIAENDGQIPLTLSELTEEKGMLWMDPAIWESFIEKLVDQGELTAPLAVDQVIDLSILEEISAG